MSQRESVLALYRAFVRVSHRMPTEHRKQFVLRTARAKFQTGLTDASEIQTQLAYGHCMLDQALAQQEHLTRCQDDGILDVSLTAKMSGAQHENNQRRYQRQ
jgi:hypothetical protein